MTAHPRQELDRRLTTLRSGCGASCVFVLDTSGQNYGASSPLPLDWEQLAEPVGPLLLAALEEHPPRRGGHLHLLRGVEPPYFAAESFAGVYLVLVIFRAPFDGATVGALVREALPEVEALTLTQPPPDPTRDARVVALRSA